MEPTTNDMKNAAKDAGQFVSDKSKQVSHKAEQAIDKASDTFRQGERKAGELLNQAGEQYEVIKERAQDALDTSADFVKRHPMATVASAVAVGFVAAVLLRRTRH